MHCGEYAAGSFKLRTSPSNRTDGGAPGIRSKSLALCSSSILSHRSRRAVACNPDFCICSSFGHSFSVNLLIKQYASLSLRMAKRGEFANSLNFPRVKGFDSERRAADVSENCFLPSIRRKVPIARTSFVIVSGSVADRGIPPVIHSYLHQGRIRNFHEYLHRAAV